MCTELSSAGAHETNWLPQGTDSNSSPTPKCHMLSTVCDQQDLFAASVAGYDGESLNNANLKEVPAAQQNYVI